VTTTYLAQAEVWSTYFLDEFFTTFYVIAFDLF